MPRGVDIYQQYNTVTDWNALSRDASFAYIKLTDGGGRAQVRGDAYVAGARAVGIKVGGYHYMEATPSPEVQADVFFAELRRLNALDLAPALDIEEPSIPSGSRIDYGQRFLRRLQANLGGAEVCIYSSASWFAALHPDTWGIPNLVDWVAAYGANDGVEHPISGYSGHVDGHQYTSVGRIAGIVGNVDVDNFSRRFLSTPQPASEDDTMIIECDQVGVQSILSGAILTDLNVPSAAAIDRTLFPRAYVDAPVYNLLKAASDQQKSLPAKLDAVLAAVQALPAAIAAAIPASGGGLSQQQLTAVVAAGVKTALSGATETLSFPTN